MITLFVEESFLPKQGAGLVGGVSAPITTGERAYGRAEFVAEW
jgi:hypothetical protein